MNDENTKELVVYQKLSDKYNLTIEAIKEIEEITHPKMTLKEFLNVETTCEHVQQGYYTLMTPMAEYEFHIKNFSAWLQRYIEAEAKPYDPTHRYPYKSLKKYFKIWSNKCIKFNRIITVDDIK